MNALPIILAVIFFTLLGANLLFILFGIIRFLWGFT
jgi:hypothetical protein